MAGRGGGKKDIDPEELMRRKFRAKCLFRALGRLVMANTYWLIEGIDEYQGVEDVKRRVEQAVRGKAKKKDLLNINDKALLNKPADERTDREKQYLYRIIGGLKCFKRYPNHVKRKLAALTYFKYYCPGRVIVRQHQEAHAMYFIVTGEVTVSQMIFDELLQQYQSVDVGIMRSGDMFGEVSLLHNIPRTATVTTNGHCELLALMKEDFKNVLQVSVQKQWDEVRRAMSAFTYFDALDEVARREGCIVAKMKTYEPNETMLGDGAGVPNFVYFVLTGRCQMIESIQMTVVTRLGKNFYTLYDPYVPKEESEEDLDAKYFGAGRKDSKEPKQDISNEIRKQSTTEKKESESKEKVDGVVEVVVEGGGEGGGECGNEVGNEGKGVKEGEEGGTEGEDCRGAEESKGGENAEAKIEGEPESEVKAQTEEGEKRTSAQRESIPIVYKKSSLRVAEGSDTPFVTQSSEGNVIKNESQTRRTSFRISVGSELKVALPPNLRTYFMQVCIMNPGSSFGFGENMRNRRIVALTHVECMLLPKIWLLQKNTANIWTRIQHYLEKKIPTTKQLFKEFVSSRRWQDFKDQLVEDVVARNNTVNWTSVHDVPYSIRMNETLDI